MVCNFYSNNKSGRGFFCCISVIKLHSYLNGIGKYISFIICPFFRVKYPLVVCIISFCTYEFVSDSAFVPMHLSIMTILSPFSSFSLSLSRSISLSLPLPHSLLPSFSPKFLLISITLFSLSSLGICIALIYLSVTYGSSHSRLIIITSRIYFFFFFKSASSVPRLLLV